MTHQAPAACRKSDFTSLSSARIRRRNSGRRSSRRELAPSDNARSGASCTSTNRPATPTATAARASVSMNCGCPPEAVPAAARKLHAVGGVEHHRPAGLAHNLQPAHVHHQVVVAEGGAALGEQHPGIAGGDHLFHGVPDIVRRHELALLDVDDAAGAPGGHQQVRLAAQEGGDLQDIGHFGGRLRLAPARGYRSGCGSPRPRRPPRIRRPFPQAPARGIPPGWCGWPCRTTP